MAMSKKWIDVVRRKLHRSSHPDNVHPHRKSDSFEEEPAALPPSSGKKDLTKRNVAAVKIQAFLRGYLVRRAFRALRGPRTERLGKSENLFKIVQRKLRKSSHTKNRESISIEEADVNEESSFHEEPSRTVPLTSSSPETETTGEGSAAISQTFRTDDSISTSSKKKRSGKSMNCFTVIRRRSHRQILYPNGNIPSNSTEKEIAKEENIDIEDPIKTASSTTSSAKNEETTEETACCVDVNGEVSSTPSSEKKESTKEDTAAGSDERDEELAKETVNLASANGAASSTGPSEDNNFAASSSSPKTETTREDSAVVREKFRTGDGIATSSKKKIRGKSMNCFTIIRRRSHRQIPYPNGNTRSNSTREAVAKEESINVEDPIKTASSTSSAKNEETGIEAACVVDVNGEISSTLSWEKKDSHKEDTAARINEGDEELAKETFDFSSANGAPSSPKTEMKILIPIIKRLQGFNINY